MYICICILGGLGNRVKDWDYRSLLKALDIIGHDTLGLYSSSKELQEDWGIKRWSSLDLVLLIRVRFHCHHWLIVIDDLHIR